jgi:hypothetical protein
VKDKTCAPPPFANPALAYLDAIRAVKERTTVPVAAYNVSGEHSIIEFAAKASSTASGSSSRRSPPSSAPART